MTFCALCIRDIAGPAKQAPLGRGNALVSVCDSCHDDHPRSGRVGTFNDSTRCNMGSVNSDGIRRRSSKGGTS